MTCSSQASASKASPKVCKIVWGTDQGVFSGKNAFGGDVQEVGVAALYMTDTTTGYQTS